MEARIRAGAAAWSNYRKAIKKKTFLIDKVDLSRGNFLKYDFSGCHFESCNFSASDFSGSDFSGATFSGCIFRQTNFSGTKMARTSFATARFEKCHFNGSELPWSNFSNSDLLETSFSEANLRECDFSKSILVDCDLEKTNATGGRFIGASLSRSSFKNANLTRCDLSGSSLKGCKFSYAVLLKCILDNSRWDQCSLNEVQGSHACAASAGFVACDLSKSTLDGLLAKDAKFKSCSFVQSNMIAAIFVGSSFLDCRLDYAIACKCDFSSATIVACSIFGVSIWGSITDSTMQKNLIIRGGAYNIIVNSLDYSFFLFQCMKNANFRKYFESTSEKLVLILGRFTDERMEVINAVRGALVSEGLIPVVFDFEKPDTQDLSEVVLSLALIARLTIVDLSDPKCAPHEIATIAPNVNSPIASLIEAGQRPYAMFSDMLKRYPWVLDPHSYTSVQDVGQIVKGKLLPQCEAYIASR